MRRPLVIVAISYIFGIIIGVYLKIGMPIILFTGISLVILILINNTQMDNIQTHINDLKINNKRTRANHKKSAYIKVVILVLITIIASYTKTIWLNKEYDSFYRKYNRRRNSACGNNMQ